MMYTCHAEPPQPLIITLTTTLESEAQDISLDVNLHWSIAENKQMSDLITSYVVTVISGSPELNQSVIMYMTRNTSIQFKLFRDQNYNISVAARNCVGHSEPAEIYITRDG